MGSNIRFVEKHEPREYTSIATNNGIVLCDKEEGSFLVLRYAQDIERLKELLDKIEIRN